MTSRFCSKGWCESKDKYWYVWVFFDVKTPVGRCVLRNVGKKGCSPAYPPLWTWCWHPLCGSKVLCRLRTRPSGFVLLLWRWTGLCFPLPPSGKPVHGGRGNQSPDHLQCSPQFSPKTTLHLPNPFTPQWLYDLALTWWLKVPHPNRVKTLHSPPISWIG